MTGSSGFALFAQLFVSLDRTTSTTLKVQALADYFGTAPLADRVWTIALLSGRRPRRTVTTTQLRNWAAQCAGLPLWLVEEAYPVVGDLAETIALILPAPSDMVQPTPSTPGDAPITTLATMQNGAQSPGPTADLADWIVMLRGLAQADDKTRHQCVLQAWQTLGTTERFVFNKLITGGFRMGVSQKLMTRALAAATAISEVDLALRLMGHWDPAEVDFETLVLAPDPQANLSRPYPFYLATQLDAPPQELGDPADWVAEWKWDGIRGQIVYRGGTAFIWSRGEELITDRFPDLTEMLDLLPDGTVLDGEILAWQHTHKRPNTPPKQGELPLGDVPLAPATEPDIQAARIPGLAGQPQPFAQLQKRITRKSVSKKLLQEVPAHFLAYDLLEIQGDDIRTQPLAQRRASLEQILQTLPADAPISASPLVQANTWDALENQRKQARGYHAEGLMLKHRISPYQDGRKKGDWWKWKLDPLSIDAVMIYAQAGHGRRANLFTDFTFAVADETGALQPFTKAYSGLTDAEFRKITAWVRKNTLERYGPVRKVRPELVFEIAFEGIQRSPRHKSGIALRFPRMARWRQDKPASEANTLADLTDLLSAFEQ